MQGSDEKEIHQLEYVCDDDAVKCKLEHTRLEIETRAAEKSSLEQNETDENKEARATGGASANKNANTSPDEVHQNIEVSEITNMQIPAELNTLLTSTHAKSDARFYHLPTLDHEEDRVTSLARSPAAYSTP